MAQLTLRSTIPLTGLFLLFGSLISACAHSQPIVRRDSDACAELAAIASIKRARVLAMRAPISHDVASSDEAPLAFLSTEMRPFLEAGRQAIREAEAAYAQALHGSPTERLVVSMYAEVGEMHLHFVAEALKGGLSAMPRPVRDDPELLLAYRRAIEDGTETERVEARNNAAICRARANGRAELLALYRRCEEIARALDRLTAPRP